MTLFALHGLKSHKAPPPQEGERKKKSHLLRKKGGEALAPTQPEVRVTQAQLSSQKKMIARAGSPKSPPAPLFSGFLASERRKKEKTPDASPAAGAPPPAAGPPRPESAAPAPQRAPGAPATPRLQAPESATRTAKRPCKRGAWCLFCFFRGALVGLMLLAFAF